MGQNIVQFWPGVVLTLLALSIPGVVACVIQFFLSKSKDIKYGRILLVVSFVVTTVFVIVCVTNGLKVIKTPVGETSIGDETLDDVKITIYMIYDEKGEIEAFSDMKIKDSKTGEIEYVPLIINSQGELIGGEKALAYKEKVERLVSDDNLTGESQTVKEMKKLYVEKFGSEKWEVVILGLMLYLVFIIQLIIHKAVRSKVNKKQYIAEVERMKILEL